MDDERYTIKHLIRKSNIGGVYMATDNTLEREVVVRRFFKEESSSYKEGYEKRFLEKCENFAQIEYLNINSWLDSGIDDDGPYIVSPARVGNSIYGIITQEGPISEYEVYEMAKQCLEGFLVMHDMGLHYGAFTTRSVAFAKKTVNKPRALLMDLGLNDLVKIVLGKNMGDLNLADPSLTAPELFDDFKPTRQSDFFSLGQLCYISLAGGHPLACESDEDIQKVYNSNQLEPLSYHAAVSPGFEAWINGLLRADPQERPKFAKEALASLDKIKVESEQPQHLVKAIPEPTGELAPEYTQVATQLLTGPSSASRSAAKIAFSPTNQPMRGGYPHSVSHGVANNSSNKTMWIVIFCGIFILLLLLIILLVFNSTLVRLD